MGGGSDWKDMNRRNGGENFLNEVFRRTGQDEEKGACSVMKQSRNCENLYPDCDKNFTKNSKMTYIRYRRETCTM